MKEKSSTDRASCTEAADLLHTEIYERDGYWYRFLLNNRRKDRDPPYRIPHSIVRGHISYSLDALFEFIEWERRRRLGTVKLTGQAAQLITAYGVGEAEARVVRSQLKCSFSLHVDSRSKRRNIQLVIESPLSVFQLTLREAKLVARELDTAIRNYRGASHSQQRA
jgi:hypothetical protein